MGSLAFPTGSRVYLDTSALIDSVEGSSNYRALLLPVWQQWRDRDIILTTSELTLLEVLVEPLRQNATELTQFYEQLLAAETFELVPIDHLVLKAAALLRSQLTMRTPDAIHAVTAIHRQCSHFLTSDRGFRRIPNLNVVIVGDFAQ